MLFHSSNILFQYPNLLWSLVTFYYEHILLFRPSSIFSFSSCSTILIILFRIYGIRLTTRSTWSHIRLLLDTRPAEFSVPTLLMLMSFLTLQSLDKYSGFKVAQPPVFLLRHHLWEGYLLRLKIMTMRHGWPWPWPWGLTSPCWTPTRHFNTLGYHMIIIIIIIIIIISIIILIINLFFVDLKIVTMPIS